MDEKVNVGFLSLRSKREHVAKIVKVFVKIIDKLERKVI